MKATTPIPQITLKAFVLGVILAAVLAGANTYLGLFAGMTVSSAIAAAGVAFMVPVPGEYLHEGRGAQLYLRWSQPFG